MTNKNDFTTPAFASVFDVLDLSYLFVAQFGLFAPGLSKLDALKTDALLAARQTQAPHRELADALGDF